MAVQPIPEGFHTVTPYLTVEGVDQLIKFLAQAFNAEEVHRTALPDGRVAHAQVKIGDSYVMLGEAMQNHPAMPASLYLYVKDVDAWYQQAIKAGAVSLVEPMDMFYGDRSGGVKDLCGNQWWIATHIEDVSNEELAQRVAGMAPQGA